MTDRGIQTLVRNGQGLTRGQRLWERMLQYRQTARLSLSRAELITESYKETEGFATPVRKAKAFEKIVTHIPIYIEEDDLLAGAFAARPMYFEWYPEFAVDQKIGPEDLAEGDTVEKAERIVEYFKDRSFRGSFLARMGDDKRRIMAETGEEGAWIYRVQVTLNIDKGYHSVNYEKALQKGFLGVLEEVEAELQATPIQDDESFRKRSFLQGMVIVLKAGIQYARRHSSLARDLSQKATGRRKAEFERIADICEWVPAHPARSFYEAVQSSWLLHVMMHVESRAQESPGRMDQYLYPYYKSDMEEGRLTREEAIEILECLRVKMSTLRLFDSKIFRETISAEAQYHNVTLGGQTADGKDATNELSYLFLEAASRTRTPHPTLSIRWHDKIQEDFLLKGLELVKSGLGYPAFFNDNSAIDWLLQQGFPLETARGYCYSGCVHHIIPGKTSPLEPLFISIPKCLEFALHNGVDPRTGKQVGPKTGEFFEFDSYDDFVGSFKRQVKYFSELGGSFIREQRIARANIVPAMLSSAFFDECIKSGKCLLSDGIRYVMLMQISVGMIDAADSLAALKKCVFEEGAISKRELLEALSLNFEGKEEIQKLLLNAPKYGNDDDYVDTIAAELYSWWQKMVSEIDSAYGAKYLPAPYSVSNHGAAGKRVGALPSGRLAWMALADGSVSACTGMDTHGPTALMNSAGKIDQPPLLGTLLNMKFHPLVFKSLEDMKKVLALIKTYFGYGGKHVQFNVVDTKTLREAQKHPEQHRNLIVRVAGYSALFVELHPNVQEEIISRTEHAMA